MCVHSMHASAHKSVCMCVCVHYYVHASVCVCVCTRAHASVCKSVCVCVRVANGSTYIISTQKQPSCKKRCSPVQNGQCEKVVKSKGEAKNWL